MATTVVPSAATTETFEDAFERAVLQSERLRVTVVIVGLLAIAARWLFLTVFFPDAVQNQLGGSINVVALGVIGLAVLISDTVAGRLDGPVQSMTPHGAMQVKGREQPVQVYELA